MLQYPQRMQRLVEVTNVVSDLIDRVDFGPLNYLDNSVMENIYFLHLNEYLISSIKFMCGFCIFAYLQGYESSNQNKDNELVPDNHWYFRFDYFFDASVIDFKSRTSPIFKTQKINLLIFYMNFLLNRFMMQGVKY